MGLVFLELNTKVLAKRDELVVRRWGEGFVFMEQPQRPLMCAKHTGMGWQEPTDTGKPSVEKSGVERGVVGD